MIKYTAEFSLPDDATYAEIEEAKINAEWKWRPILTKAEKAAMTDLTDKCGSCKYFIPKEGKYNLRGDCAAGRTGFRQRSLHKCSAYEKKKGRPRES